MSARKSSDAPPSRLAARRAADDGALAAESITCGRDLSAPQSYIEPRPPFGIEMAKRGVHFLCGNRPALIIDNSKRVYYIS